MEFYSDSMIIYKAWTLEKSSKPVTKLADESECITKHFTKMKVRVVDFNKCNALQAFQSVGF